MPPRKKIAAPIDRPLSRAYLRQFKGWSTAYPPGTSDPTTMKVMENVFVNRGKTLQVRPGLQLMSREATGGKVLDARYALRSTLEPFYTNAGALVHLAAMHDSTLDRVVFRVLVPSGLHSLWVELTDVSLNFDVSAWAGQPGNTPSFTAGTTYVKFLQIDNKILALSDNGESLIVFHVGATKKVPEYALIADPDWTTGRGELDWPSRNWIEGPQTTAPTHAVDFSSPSGLAADPNGEFAKYNYAFTYTFSNELGETAAAPLAQIKASRAWGSWSWNTPDPAYAGTQTTTPSLTTTTVASAAADQISLYADTAAFAAALAAGATKMNFYVMSWSIQDSVPVELELVGSRDLTPSATFDSHGWFMLTPATLGLGTTIPIPTAENRVKVNTTEPPRAGQGIVAADRLVLVNNPVEAAVIRWSSNLQGDYLNLAQSRGGGYKTLTSGNMQVPACVKLWQNPQSVDTLTILNNGTDGYSTAYYMSPSTVTSQSDNTIIMGFEETTATPGTVSPYGCEVANNALYHPLDDQLMKSTASNYNINHKAMTDLISPDWQRLVNKDKIVSCFHDQRIYFLVHNPVRPLEPDCRGNEVWVLDLASEGGTWSRWLVGGVSLRKVAVLGRLQLSLVRPEGVYYFDEHKGLDDTAERGDDVVTVQQLAIPWQVETNTQGANRAHDAWAHLRQVSVVVGNFTGKMRYGIRGKDLHGKDIDVSKVYSQQVHTFDDDATFDAEDHLRVARELKEWFFYASSVTDEGVVQPSYGQLSLVQYRYTPVSVNVGYDFGSVETFEYGRAEADAATQLTDNGIPQPYLDTNRT